MITQLNPVREELSNGLRAIVTPMPSVHRVVISADLRVGSRYEAPEDGGISHFLEHMLFRGTPRYPSAHELAVAFETLGGTLTASTAADHGTLAIGVPAENLHPVLELFAEVFMQPTLGDIDVERGIVREEILEDLDEDDRLIDGETLVRRLSFGDHPLGRPITGVIENLEQFTVDGLTRHHAQHYTGSSTVVSIAGPIDAEATLRQIEKAFASLPRGGDAAPMSAPEPHEAPRFSYVRHTGSQTALHVAFRGPRDHDPLEPAVEMLLRVIDDGMATRLYHRLCDSRGLCYDAAAHYETYADTGLVEFATETGHDQATVVLDELLQLTEELAQEGPTADELDKAMRRCRWQHEAMLDDPGDVAEYLALAALTQTAPTPAARLAELGGVSLEQVRDAAGRIFRPEGLSTVAVGTLPERARRALERRVLG